MNENEIVTGTTAPTESVTAAPVGEESVVSNESSVPDTGEMIEEITSDVSENESVESSLSLPEGIDADALVSSIAAEGVSEVMSEAGIEQETVVQTAIVTQPVVTEAVIVTEPVISETEMSEVAEIVTEAAEITESATAETEVTEVVAVPETPNGVMGFVQSNPAVVGIPAAIIALAVAFLAVTRRTRPKRGIIENNDDVKENMNARERDAARLEANRPKKKDKRSQKVAKEKEKKDFAKKVLNTIPYKKILSDDIFFLGKKMYSKAYTFDDINFNLSDEEQQYMYLERYIEFLSILDDTVDCQICCWNSQINLDDFKKKTLLPQKADDLFEYRYEFNSRVLEENIRKGQNAIQKHMYITLTIKAPDEETARRRFKSLDITATNTFNRIGNTNMRVLTSQERVEMLKDFFVGTDDMPVPQLTEKDFAKGIDKLYCAPDYFDFKKDYFMFNNTYAKTIYIREYPSTATSEILTELLATGIEIMVTTNIETYDSAEARKLVQHQITAIDTDMAKREVKAAQHGNFSNQMPQRIRHLIKHGLIESELKGLPAKRYFRIIPDVDKLNSLMKSGEEIQEAIARRYDDEIKKRSDRRKKKKLRLIEVEDTSVKETAIIDTINEDTASETYSESVMEEVTGNVGDMSFFVSEKQNDMSSQNDERVSSVATPHLSSADVRIDAFEVTQVDAPDSYIDSNYSCPSPYYVPVVCSPAYGGTSPPEPRTEIKENINQRYFFENQSFIPSVQDENFVAVESVERGIERAKHKLSFREIIEELGFDYWDCEYLFGFYPNSESDLRDFSDADRGCSKLTFPETLRTDRKTVLTALKFLCASEYYSYQRNGEESSLKGFINVTLGVMADLILADDFKFNGKFVSYTEVIDEVNAIVREYGGLYEFIVDFYYEWGRILREEGSSIRNKAAYMKVRMWDWMKRWQIEKESVMAELE